MNRSLLILGTILLTLPTGLLVTETSMAIEPDFKDVEYATVNQHKLLLDVYQPDRTTKAPLVVWIHGGAWRSGSKNRVPVTRLLIMDTQLPA